MDMQTVSQSVSIPPVQAIPAANNATAARPVAPQALGSASSREADSVNLVGLESINQAFKMLSNKEALPIPEQVGKAIRVLVHRVLSGLPDGSGFPAYLN